LNGWLFRSADQGAHWTQIPKNLNSSVNALAKDSSRYVFAGTSGNGIFCSTDSGVTWDSCNIGLTTRFVYALAVNDGGQVFTGTNKGVFRSNNHGGNWNPYGLTDTIVTSLAVSPNGDLFAGTNNSGVYRRSGPGWVPCNNGSIDQRITALAIQSNGELYSGTRFGIFRSTNGSCDWTRVGLKITHVISLAVTPNEHIFAGVLGSGVYRTTDLGNNWTLTGGDGNCNALIAYNSSGIISAATYNGILHSTNDGGNWASFGLSGKIVQALAKNPSGLVYAGTRDSGVFVDSAGTGNWKPVGLKKNWINAIAIDLTGFIYAGTRDSGVFRSRGDGIWSQTGLTTTDVRSIAVNDSRRVFAGLSSGHVFWSADSGGNWTPKALSVDTVKAMTINSEGAVFAGTSTGVFRSADSGLTWVAYNPDLTTANVNALALTPKQYLVAGTYGGGVFRSEPSTPVEEGHGPIPRSFVLLQNFPNPFNPSTTIRYSLPRRDRISLVVFNMLGQQVRVLSEEEQTAGPHSVVWDGKDSKGRSLSSGLYFYRLTSESYSETKKMLLMK
jgi:ligand-binding sensor domain-containing protein